MPATPSWQIWRTACLPIIESIINANNNAIRSNINRVQYPKKRVGLQSHTRLHSTCRYYSTASPASEQPQTVTKEVQERKAELDDYGKETYPRYKLLSESRTVAEICRDMQDAKDSVKEENDIVEVGGRITAIRRSGKKLAFIDIDEDDSKLQIMLNQKSVAETVSENDLNGICQLLRRGDFISIRGKPYIAQNGAPSIKAVALPELSSPCLERFPMPRTFNSQADDSSDSQAMDRHVQMLTDSSFISTLKLRAAIIAEIRSFFEERKFVEVQTPILSALAGGASARPFETSATEFAHRKLSLRIAPELWLKRLVVGGMTRVFEIGPSFRNEGLDKTHNPEFTTCEFYAVRYDLSQLMQLTQDLLCNIAATVMLNAREGESDKQTLNSIFASASYKTIDFMPALNSALDLDLPNLDSSTARNEILEIFSQKSLPIPDSPTLPRLLDKLSSIYLEPNCKEPTWIMHIPECMSPLSKSFIHPTCTNHQPVAARAELFINHKEVVNCYEEENDPFKQRRKFLDQQRHALNPETGKVWDDEVMRVDEDYIRALEWGLPPTGGWGCGIDRLVMLCTGRERISDVLSFGNLRAVTRGAERRSESDKEGRQK